MEGVLGSHVKIGPIQIWVSQQMWGKWIQSILNNLMESQGKSGKSGQGKSEHFVFSQTFFLNVNYHEIKICCDIHLKNMNSAC